MADNRKGQSEIVLCDNSLQVGSLISIRNLCVWFRVTRYLVLPRPLQQEYDGYVLKFLPLVLSGFFDFRAPLLQKCRTVIKEKSSL